MITIYDNENNVLVRFIVIDIAKYSKKIFIIADLASLR